jgi:hypothetical protein
VLKLNNFDLCDGTLADNPEGTEGEGGIALVLDLPFPIVPYCPQVAIRP